MTPKTIVVIAATRWVILARSKPLRRPLARDPFAVQHRTGFRGPLDCRIPETT